MCINRMHKETAIKMILLNYCDYDVGKISNVRTVAYVRSKYCASTGLVIARMDHFCVWLNHSIGYGNHRTFILFLLVHLAAVVCVVVLILR